MSGSHYNQTPSDRTSGGVKRALCTMYRDSAAATSVAASGNTFFDKPPAEEVLLPIAKQAATLILGGEEQGVEEAIALAEAHPAILEMIVVARDPLGRAVKGTLLQIAAMVGDVDLKEGMEEELKKAEEKEQKAATLQDKTDAKKAKENLKKQRGVVERLAAIKGGLSPEKVAAQLTEVITSENAIKENQQRVDRIVEAIKTFGEGILDKAKEYKEHKEDYNNFKTFQTLCQPVIDALKKALQHDPNKVTTSGYLFDPVILQKAAEWYVQNIKRFEGWWSIVSDVFWVSGCGTLQQHLSVRDGHVAWYRDSLLARYGINEVLHRHTIPPRVCQNSDGLGRYFYLGHYGPSIAAAYVGGGRGNNEGRWGKECFLVASLIEYSKLKTTALQSLMQHPVRSKPAEPLSTKVAPRF